MATGKSEIIEEAKEDPRVTPINHRNINCETKSLIVVPVRDSSGLVVAILYAVNKKAPQNFN